MDTGKTIEDTVAGTTLRSTLITSSSPSPSPVRLSPVCSIEPSGELVLLKNTKYWSETILWFSASPSALASRSKSVPVVDRTSQPSPTATAFRPGAALVRETLPPLVRLTPIVWSLSPSMIEAVARSNHRDAPVPSEHRLPTPIEPAGHRWVNSPLPRMVPRTARSSHPHRERNASLRSARTGGPRRRFPPRSATVRPGQRTAGARPRARCHPLRARDQKATDRNGSAAGGPRGSLAGHRPRGRHLR